MNIFRQTSVVAFLLFIPIFFYVIARRSNSLNDDLKKNGKVTNGIVFKATHGKNTTKFLHYRFIDGNGKTNENSVGVELINKEYFIGRSFPIIYDSANTENNCLLVTPQYFQIYGLDFPDSLNWVWKYEP